MNVKTLEWENYPDDGTEMFEGLNDKRQYLERAIHPFGAYCLMYKAGAGYSIKSDYTDKTFYYGTASDAREAAEAEYKRRVLSALTNQPDNRHAFVPNKKYPWFCAHCGYAPHEPLKHIQPDPYVPQGVKSE